MSKEKKSFRKAVSEHFFDFLMLFLAISLGFIVDNYRDYRSKNELSTTLAKDLLTDLSSDSLSIENMLQNGKMKASVLDSLLVLINQASNKKNDSLLYQYSAYVSDIPWFDRHGATIELLLNSGTMSNFTNVASLAITDYDIDCKKILVLIMQEREVLDAKVYPFQQTIFHTENFETYIQHGRFKHRPDLHNWNESSRWIYHNYITEMRMLNRKKMVVFGNLLKSNLKTGNIIRSEYKLN